MLERIKVHNMDQLLSKTKDFFEAENELGL